MYDIILFDLDGTLTNPQEGITKCVQYALHKLGIEEPDLNKLVPFIGPPLAKMFKESYSLSDEEAMLAVQYYRERFTAGGMFENLVYPGIAELLAGLRAEDRNLLVATSKPTVFSVEILKHFDLLPYFSNVIGSNLDGTRVEKSEVIEYALTQLGSVAKDRIIMIGDRKHDILGAKNNGIASIAVRYGFGSPEEIEAAQPDHVVATVAELGRLLRA